MVSYDTIKVAKETQTMSSLFIKDENMIVEHGLVASCNEGNRGKPQDEHVEICEDYLGWFAHQSRKIMKNRSSYGLKHVVERHTGKYVTNGAFILAAFRLGYRVRRIRPDSPNAFFNLKLAEE